MNIDALLRWPCALHGAARGEPCESYRLADGGDLIAVCGRDGRLKPPGLVEVSTGVPIGVPAGN